MLNYKNIHTSIYIRVISFKQVVCRALYKLTGGKFYTANLTVDILK